MSLQKTTILTLFNFTFHSFSSHKWQKGEMKHKNQKSSMGFRSTENHEWSTCYFTWECLLLYLYLWPESGLLCFPCFLCSLWRILCSLRSCVFLCIFHYNLSSMVMPYNWHIPTDNSVPFAKHTVLLLSKITGNLKSLWEIKYTQQSDATKKTGQMSHNHNSIFNEHKQDKATGKKDFA